MKRGGWLAGLCRYNRDEMDGLEKGRQLGDEMDGQEEVKMEDYGKLFIKILSQEFK